MSIDTPDPSLVLAGPDDLHRGASGMLPPPAMPARGSVTEGMARLYSALWRLSVGHRKLLLFAFALLVGSQMARLLVPFVAGKAISTLQLQGIPGVSTAGTWLALVFVATAVSWLLHGPGRVLERNVALIVRERLSAQLVDRLVNLPLSWHQNIHSGAAAHRVQQSSRALYEFAQSQFVYLQNVVRLVGPVVALSLIDPWVGLLAFVGLTVIAVSITGFDRAMIKLTFLENAAERRYASALIDAVANIVSIAALRQARGVSALVADRLRIVFGPVRRAIIVNEAKWCTVDLASQALSCSLLAFFVLRMIQGETTIAPVPAATDPSPTIALGNVYMVWEYAMQAGAVLSTIASQFTVFARQHADFVSGDEVMNADLGSERSSAKAAPAANECPGSALDAASEIAARRDWHMLVGRSVSFRHPRTGSGLHDVTIRLRRGRRYALVGGSGSGKSTLLRVLAGLYLPANACWQLDDARPFDEFSGAAWLRDHVTMIPQDAEVIEGTLAENLGLCEAVDGPPSAERFADALIASAASDFVSTDAAGLATRVNERGSNWSGGQRQRVALARGLLAASGSGLVLLDEPTAALDPATEQRVMRQMLAALADSCVIASIHRMDLLPQFDEVILMRDGRVVLQGTENEVAAQDSQFAKSINRSCGRCKVDGSGAARAPEEVSMPG